MSTTGRCISTIKSSYLVTWAMEMFLSASTQSVITCEKFLMESLRVNMVRAPTSTPPTRRINSRLTCALSPYSIFIDLSILTAGYKAFYAYAHKS